MKKIFKTAAVILGGIALIAGCVAVSYQRGKAAGLKLEQGRTAHTLALENWVYYKTSENEDWEQLTEQFELNMWLPISEIHEFATTKAPPYDEREAAGNILRRIVLHFYLNPRELTLSEKVDFASAASEEIEKMRTDPSNTGDDSEKVVDDVELLLLPALENLEEQLSEMVSPLREQEIGSGILLKELIQQRYFPGRRKEAGSHTIWLPGGSGSFPSSGNGSFELNMRSPHFDSHAIFDGEMLKINGVEIAEIPAGAEVDFRVPLHVFINGEKYDFLSRNSPAG